MSLINTNVTVLEVNQNTINKPFEVGYQGDVDGHRITSAYGIYVDVPKGTQINTWGGYYQKSRVIMYAKK